jgi:hypothetical protein
MTAAELIYEIETDILKIIARMLGTGKIGTLEWQVTKLSQIGSLDKQARELIMAKIKAVRNLAVDEVVKKAFDRLEINERRYKEAVKAGRLQDVLPITVDPSIRNILTAWENSAKYGINLTMQTLLDNCGEVYRDTITRTTAETILGVKSGRQAIRETMREWAAQGVPSIVDRAGRQWTTEAYVNAVIRTNTYRVVKETTETRMDEYGVDLAEVSWHAASRVTHYDYQGQIYSRSGRDEVYPPLSDTGYGDAAGLMGVNCTHYLIPFVPGISVKQEGLDISKEENERLYKQSQEQRRLEREIRSAKREAAVFKSGNDDAGYKEAMQLVRDRQATMREFIDESGRTRRYDREQIEV